MNKKYFCEYCKQEIDAHDGRQKWIKIYYDTSIDNCKTCSFCDESFEDYDDVYLLGGKNI